MATSKIEIVSGTKGFTFSIEKGLHSQKLSDISGLVDDVSENGKIFTFLIDDLGKSGQLKLQATKTANVSLAADIGTERFGIGIVGKIIERFSDSTTIYDATEKVGASFKEKSATTRSTATKEAERINRELQKAGI